MKKLLTICAVLCAMAAMTACKNGTSQPESDTLVQNEQSRGGSIITVDATIFSEVAFLDGVLLIDVRTPEEYAEGHIRGAVNIDVKADDFDESIKDLEGNVAVYCRGGKRSLDAAVKLAGNGCRVYNLEGGIKEWKEMGFPVEQ